MRALDLMLALLGIRHVDNQVVNNKMSKKDTSYYHGHVDMQAKYVLIIAYR